MPSSGRSHAVIFDRYGQDWPFAKVEAAWFESCIRSCSFLRALFPIAQSAKGSKHQNPIEEHKSKEHKSMAKETKQTLDHGRGRTLGLRSAKSASLDVLSVSSSQTGSQTADKSDPRAEVSPQGALPVLSVPGGAQTESELADKHREDANVEVSPEGVLPVISVPGGSRL
jgi:hypothetical protein